MVPVVRDQTIPSNAVAAGSSASGEAIFVGRFSGEAGKISSKKQKMQHDSFAVSWHSVHSDQS